MATDFDDYMVDFWEHEANRFRDDLPALDVALEGTLFGDFAAGFGSPQLDPVENTTFLYHQLSDEERMYLRWAVLRCIGRWNAQQHGWSQLHDLVEISVATKAHGATQVVLNKFLAIEEKMRQDSQSFLSVFSDSTDLLLETGELISSLVGLALDSPAREDGLACGHLMKWSGFQPFCGLLLSAAAKSAPDRWEDYATMALKAHVTREKFAGFENLLRSRTLGKRLLDGRRGIFDLQMAFLYMAANIDLWQIRDGLIRLAEKSRLIDGPRLTSLRQIVYELLGGDPPIIESIVRGQHAVHLTYGPALHHFDFFSRFDHVELAVADLMPDLFTDFKKLEVRQEQRPRLEDTKRLVDQFLLPYTAVSQDTTSSDTVSSTIT